MRAQPLEAVYGQVYSPPGRKLAPAFVRQPTQKLSECSWGHARSMCLGILVLTNSFVMQREFLCGIDLPQSANLPYSKTQAAHQQDQEHAKQRG